MTKPTQGPWVAIPLDNLQWRIVGDGGTEIVCDLPESSAVGINAADARLIAAAPELLDLCRQCREHLDGAFIVGDPTPREGQLWDALDDAIAKAEGRS